MSLKAGRVGVNPADVDPVTGRISPDATDSYTKAQADDKFLSKSDASLTYETKSEASALQPKTLAVPISMLDGSKLTVETALTGLNEGKGSFLAENQSAFTNIVENAEVTTEMGNYLVKIGKIVFAWLSLKDVVTTGWSTLIAAIPEGYRPRYTTRVRTANLNNMVNFATNGDVKLSQAIDTASYVSICACWITN